MQPDTANLATLIGSRICHDLISPIGAISNGLELLTLSGAAGLGPEFELINDSCSNATARIRFFRVAFGTTPGTQQRMSRPEVAGILSDVGQGSRLQSRWMPTADLGRLEVQLAFLALMCFETALPQGGEVVLDRRDDRWWISGTGPRLSVVPDLWQMLSDPACRPDISPGRVQFLMLHLIARDQSRGPLVRQDKETLELIV